MQTLFGTVQEVDEELKLVPVDEQAVFIPPEVPVETRSNNKSIDKRSIFVLNTNHPIINLTYTFHIFIECKAYSFQLYTTIVAKLTCLEVQDICSEMGRHSSTFAALIMWNSVRESNQPPVSHC